MGTGRYVIMGSTRCVAGHLRGVRFYPEPHWLLIFDDTCIYRCAKKTPGSKMFHRHDNKSPTPVYGRAYSQSCLVLSLTPCTQLPESSHQTRRTYSRKIYILLFYYILAVPAYPWVNSHSPNSWLEQAYVDNGELFPPDRFL